MMLFLLISNKLDTFAELWCGVVLYHGLKLVIDMCVYKKWLRLIVSSVLLFMAFGKDAQAQDFSLKSNLLYDARGTINLGAEAPFDNRKWTLDLSANYNAWETGNGAFRKHALVQPEVRRWFCDSFQGHFIGIHALGGIFNIGNIRDGIKILGTDFSVLESHRCQGWCAGLGAGYGYAIPLDFHWNLEFEIGAGYVYSRYSKYECAECGEMIFENRPHHYIGITKAAISIAYIF